MPDELFENDKKSCHVTSVAILNAIQTMMKHGRSKGLTFAVALEKVLDAYYELSGSARQELRSAVARKMNEIKKAQDSIAKKTAQKENHRKKREQEQRVSFNLLRDKMRYKSK